MNAVNSKYAQWGVVASICLLMIILVVVFAQSQVSNQYHTFQKVEQNDGQPPEVAYSTQSLIRLSTQTDNSSSTTSGSDENCQECLNPPIGIAQSSSVSSSESSSSQSSYPPPTLSSCPVTTQNCVPCHVSETYCRVLSGEEYGYLGWACQNNNPGNIRYSDYRIDYITAMGGEAPCADRGGFMAFSTYASGYNSVKAYHRAIDAGLHPAYQGDGYNCGAGTCNLYQFFTHYAPNNPINYTNNLTAKMSGNITGETNYRWIIQNRHDDFMAAMMQMEGFFTQ